MKKTRKMVRLLATAASLLMAAVLVVGAAAAPDPYPFKGTWYKEDPFDGSNQTLHIGGGPGNSYHVRYYDDGATVCGLDPVSDDFLYAASAQGSLTATDDVLSGNLPVYCLASPRYLAENPPPFQYTYHSDGTLTDQWGGGPWTH